MKKLFELLILCAILLQIKAAIPKPVDLELKAAEHCNEEKCQAPRCRCSGLPLPKSEFRGNETNIPQFITLTFDDAVTAMNFEQYQELLTNLTNPDQCEARACFYVSHEYTDYSKVNALYNQGHEIALHSITHEVGNDYWQNATVDVLMREFGQGIDMLEKFAKVDRRHIKGVRLPFLQMAGNNSFIAAKVLGLLYDSSWPTRDTAMWPYTLDYLSSQECPIEPCPTVSLPDFWENPMVSWIDNAGHSCAMLDGCVVVPSDNVTELCEWMKKNFVRHYEGNRSPFGMYLHAAWFNRNPNYIKAFRKFLEYVTTLPDVYLTTPSAVIQYMRHPTLGKPFKGCFKKPKSSCIPRTCVLNKKSAGELRYMTVCDECPEAYPWLDNALGMNEVNGNLQ